MSLSRAYLPSVSFPCFAWCSSGMTFGNPFSGYFFSCHNLPFSQWHADAELDKEEDKAGPVSSNLHATGSTGSRYSSVGSDTKTFRSNPSFGRLAVISLTPSPAFQQCLSLLCSGDSKCAVAFSSYKTPELLTIFCWLPSSSISYATTVISALNSCYILIMLSFLVGLSIPIQC